MNWGKGIAVALTIFIGFIVTLGVIMMRQDVDLVSEDYYKQEVDYQVQIDALNAGNQFDPIIIEKRNTFVVFELPEAFPNNVKINLYRANNENLDQTFVMENERVHPIKETDLVKGEYDVQITFTVDGKDVIQKRTLTI